MVKLTEKFSKNKIIIAIASICIILTIGTVFFITKSNNIETINPEQQMQNKLNYEYKLFKPSFQNPGDPNPYSYDFTQDMTYQDEENIYYKKIDNYNDYSIVKSRWNDILDMSESDFENKFMVISAIENTSMVGLTVNKIETDTNYLYISLIKDEKFSANDEALNKVVYGNQSSEYEEEYEETCISYILPKTMEREKIIVTRNLRNDEKDFDTQMQVAEINSKYLNNLFQYKDSNYRKAKQEASQSNEIFSLVEQDWKDMIYKRFTITKSMQPINFDNFKSLGDGFYCLQVTEYSEYLKLMNNYGVEKLNWRDFKNIYAIIIVRDNSDNSIGIDEIKTDNNGKSYLEVYKNGILDVDENFKYPATVVFVPNYRSLEANYLEIRTK